MDSFDLQSTNSTESLSSDISDNSSMITPSKRDIFLSTYRRQSFAFRNSMMHYIAKNPKNAKFYEKMVQCCKYFFIKNSVLVIDVLNYDDDDGWETLINKAWKNIDINKLLCKLWITDRLCVFPANVNNDSVASSMIPKIYQCDFNDLEIRNQTISFNELMFLCSSVEVLSLERVTVKNYDGTVLSCEELIKQLPQLKGIYYTFTTPPNNTSKNTFKELWKIPHLSNYDSVSLGNIPEEFDVDSFYSFMKKYKKTRITLQFSDEISEEYKTRLEAIVDEIIGAENHEHKIPYIDFPGFDTEKSNELCYLYG